MRFIGTFCTFHGHNYLPYFEGIFILWTHDKQELPFLQMIISFANQNLAVLCVKRPWFRFSGIFYVVWGLFCVEITCSHGNYLRIFCLVPSFLKKGKAFKVSLKENIETVGPGLGYLYVSKIPISKLQAKLFRSLFQCLKPWGALKIGEKGRKSARPR